MEALQKPTETSKSISAPAAEAGIFYETTQPGTIPREALTHTLVGRVEGLLECSSPMHAVRYLAEKIESIQSKHGNALVPRPQRDGSILFFVSPEELDKYDNAMAQNLLSKEETADTISSP